MLAVGLGLGLLAAAVSLSGCTGEVGGGGPRDGTAGTAEVAGRPSERTAGTSLSALPETATRVATVAVSDRVPATLVGRSWVVRDSNGRGIAGTVGSSRRLRLPIDERPLAASTGFVASVAASPSGSVVVVRRIEDGRELARVERPEEVLVAAFARDAVILGGHLSASSGRDPGVVGVSLSDGSVSVFIEPSDVPSASGVDLFRTVGITPSGRILVSGLCGPDDCAVDVVDLATGAAHRIAESAGGLLGVVTDEIAIVGSPDSDSIAGLDLVTGGRRWTRDGAEFEHAYAAGTGIVQALVDRSDTPTFRLEAIDAGTGIGRVVLSRDAVDGLTLWPDLSDASIAVLGNGKTFADAGGVGSVMRASAADLATGQLDGDAVNLDLGSDVP